MWKWQRAVIGCCKTAGYLRIQKFSICNYLMEKDVRLYEEVSEEVEPAIKLSREIIEDLKDDIRELQDSNKELQGSNKELQGSNKELQSSNKELQDSNKRLMDSKNVLLQELENAYGNMISEATGDGRSTEETVNMLMRIFSLTKEEAEAKVKEYRKE